MQVLPFGQHPSTRHIRGSNFCHVGVSGDRIGGRAISHHHCRRGSRPGTRRRLDGPPTGRIAAPSPGRHEVAGRCALRAGPRETDGWAPTCGASEGGGGGDSGWR